MKDNAKLYKLSILMSIENDTDMWLEDDSDVGEHSRMKVRYIPSESTESVAVFDASLGIFSTRIKKRWSEYYFTWRCWTSKPSWFKMKQVEWYDMEHCVFKKRKDQ